MDLFCCDVCLRQMMTATPNDVRCANDVCLTAHWGKHRIIATNGSNIIFAKQIHHIAIGAYKNIFQVEECEVGKTPARHTFQYGDVLIGQVKIEELDYVPMASMLNKK